MINIYKKEYEQAFKNKNENWRKTHDYKNLKDFSIQLDEVKKDEADDEIDDERDQELLPRIKVTKSRFNEIRDAITKANESKLMTRLKKKKYYTE